MLQLLNGVVGLYIVQVMDFSTAMEGYGLVAMSLKPQLADIWEELTGETLQKPSGERRKKRKQGSKRTTADAVSLGDTWLQAAIAKGAIQPIPEAMEHRFWVRE